MQRPCLPQSSSSSPVRIPAASCILLLTTLVVIGCAPWVTYPPIEGAAQVGHPRLEPVPSIITESIKFSNDRFAKMEGEIVFNLPAGAPAALFEDVARRLGNARPMTADDDHAIHITEVRVRAREAEADAVYPRPDGHHEMVTLKLHQRFLHYYKVQHSRLWRIHVEPPGAQYPAVAAESEDSWEPPVERDAESDYDHDDDGE